MPLLLQVMNRDSSHRLEGDVSDHHGIDAWKLTMKCRDCGSNWTQFITPQGMSRLATSDRDWIKMCLIPFLTAIMEEECLNHGLRQALAEWITETLAEAGPRGMAERELRARLAQDLDAPGGDVTKMLHALEFEMRYFPVMEAINWAAHRDVPEYPNMCTEIGWRLPPGHLMREGW